MASTALPLFSALELAVRGVRAARLGFSDVAELRVRAGRRQPFFANVTLLSVLLGGVAFYISPIILRPFGASFVGEIIESDARKQGTALYDSQNRFIGAFPARLDSDERYNNSEKPEIDTDLSGDSFTVYPDHKSLFVEAPPQPYLSCIKRLEDSHLGNPLINPHGVDGLGLINALRKGGTAGGSTLSNQLVQQLVRPKPDHETRLDGVWRKLTEIFWSAPILYSHAPNDRRFDQYLARHLPHVQFTQEKHGTIWGIESASQVLFGTSAVDLDPARQFVLAGSIKPPVAFALAESTRSGVIRDVSEKSRSKWEKVLSRARTCAKDPGVLPSARDRVTALQTLDTLGEQVPLPQADPVIEALGRELYGELWQVRARDPARRANFLANSALYGMRAELFDALGPQWSRKVAQVTMTLDLTDQRRFARPFRAATRSWLASRTDLNPIYRDWASYGPSEAEPTDNMPEVIATATDERGNLVLYYNSHVDDPAYFGTRPPAGGSYSPDREDRQLASLGKVGSALVLLKTGKVDGAARSAYAQSDTAAIEAMTRTADPRQLVSRDLVSKLYWSEASSRQKSGEPLDLAFSLANGRVSASPRTAQWAATTITNALAGDETPVAAPTLIGALKLVDLQAGKLVSVTTRLKDSYARAEGPARMQPSALIAKDDRAAAILLLSSPVCAGGTLRTLQQWCGPARSRFIWGKTGTLDISTAYSHLTGGAHHGVVRRVSVMGGVAFQNGRRFSFYLSIGGTSDRIPLTMGKPGQAGLEASAIAPLVNLIIADLASKPQGGPAYAR
jgi:Transglycosylase